MSEENSLKSKIIEKKKQFHTIVKKTIQPHLLSQTKMKQTLTKGEWCRTKNPNNKENKYEIARCVSVDKNGYNLKFSNGDIAHVSTLVCLMKRSSTVHKRLVQKERNSQIQVKPTRFKVGEKMGDFSKMLADPKLCQSMVAMFNDNSYNFERAGMHPNIKQGPGGGNAQVRPYECEGHAIGMPTGPYADLNEKVWIQFPCDTMKKEHTAQDVINEAFKRIVKRFAKDTKKKTLYYSINPNDPPGSNRIGLAIFAGEVGEDVVNYITDKIQEIPDAVFNARMWPEEVIH